MKSIFSKRHYLYIYIGLACISLTLAITSRVMAQEPPGDGQASISPETVLGEEPSDTGTGEMRSGMSTEEDAGNRETNSKTAGETDERGEVPDTRTIPPIPVRNEHQSAIEGRIQDRIINLARNMAGRMSAAVTRLEQISTRLESRIEKLSAEGVDTEEAALSVESAKAALLEAKQTLATLDDAVIDAVSSESPRELFTGVRESFKLVKDKLLEAHGYLRNAVALLKNAMREPVPDEDAESVTESTAAEDGEGEEALPTIAE